MSNQPILTDQAARDDAKKRLDTSAFIEAGAGTGKSTTLVARIIETIRSHRADISHIAAITFTERAGAELRQRLREGLAKAVKENPDDLVLASALERLDTATVGTIHSFAQQILRTHALAAELPVGFTVATGTEAADDRRARTHAIVEHWEKNLDPDVLDTLEAYGLGLLDLMPLAEKIDDAALRLDDTAFADGVVDIPALCARAANGIQDDLDAARAACNDNDDKLFQTLMTGLPDLVALLRRADPAELSVAAADIPEKSSQAHPAFRFGNVGSAKNWTGGSPKEWRDRLKEWEPAVRNALRAPLEQAVRRALADGRQVSLAARDERAREGVVDFDGLLSRAYDLLAADDQVRARAHAAFAVVLVDEFQDTDPIQWEIIRRITADPSKPGSDPLPGHLIVVGDPKQAIYSFRGADIDTYTHALEQFTGSVPPLGEVFSLTTNFRSVEGILEWVNAVFGAGMRSGMHQVAYEDLAIRHRPAHANPGPAVTVVRDPAPLPPADPAKDDEPEQDEAPSAPVAKFRSTDLEPVLIAQEIARAIRDQWQITRPLDNDDREYTRAAKFSDVAILYPARTCVPALLDALDDAGVPYRSGDTGLVFGRAPVKGLLAALAVIDDPSSELDLWAALKSPLFACGDDDLLRHRRAGGRWRITVPEQPDGPVGEAMLLLRALRFGTDAPQPVAVIDGLLQGTRLLEALAYAPRGSFETDCVRMLRAHAQQWQDDGGVGLSDFLRAVVESHTDSSRASLPEPDDRDDNAVRLMTVFGAKGLEFPIVAYAGMSHMINDKAPVIGIVDRGRYEYRSGGNLRSAGFADWDSDERKPRDVAERMRVAYVACTRARDHLIVSVCGEHGTVNRPHSSILSPFVPRQDTDVTAVDDPRITIAIAPEALPAPLPDAWDEAIAHLQSRSSVPFIALPSGQAAAALGLDAHALPQQGETDDAAEASVVERGNAQEAMAIRDGRPLGNAVHAALDRVVGAGSALPREDIADICREAVEAEGIASSFDDVQARVTRALDTDLMREALGAPRRWSELYLAAPVDFEGTELVEGFADLVFESSDGLVLVDYKTDQELTERSRQHYADQLASYADLITRATGRPVERRLILHLSPTAAQVVDFTSTQSTARPNVDSG